MDLWLLKRYARSEDTLSATHSNTVPKLHWSWHGTAALKVSREMRIIEVVVYVLQKTGFNITLVFWDCPLKFCGNTES